jgi:membrane dipeptidase
VRELVRECNRLGVLLDLSHLNERGLCDVATLSEAPLVATHSNAHALCPVARSLTDRQLDTIRDSDGRVGVTFAVAFARGRRGRRGHARRGRHAPRRLPVEVVGIERLGFGSDFDGAKVPRGIGDASGLLRPLDALLERGYDDALQQLAHENWVRVLRRAWCP